jgi:hypothetical protein
MAEVRKILFGEKRKTAYWGMQGNPETGDPVGQGGEWVLIAFFLCVLPEGGDVFQMQTSVPEGSVSLTSHSLSFSVTSLALLGLAIFETESHFLPLSAWFTIFPLVLLTIAGLTGIHHHIELFC